jgi:hypothetical protein
MAIVYDVRGAPTDVREATALLAANNAALTEDIGNANVISFDVRTAAGALTYVFEATRDGTNYFQVPAFAEWQLLAAAVVAEQFVPSVVVATTHSGNYSINCAGYRSVRVRISAYTSGNITVVARASGAVNMQMFRQIPTTLWVTATGAADTAVTATLPAPGAGLFHYITMISGMRNATAALAGTATLIHTTTNLPGSPAWSVGNAMAAGGTQVDIAVSPANPIKSSVANTATTIVMAAGGAAVLNRINVAYYVGI